MIERGGVSVGEASFPRDRLPRDGASERCDTRTGRETDEESMLRSRDIPFLMVSSTRSGRPVPKGPHMGGAVGALGGGAGNSFWSMADTGDFVLIVIDDDNTSTTAFTFDSVR